MSGSSPIRAALVLGALTAAATAQTLYDYEPAGPEVVLDTYRTRVVPKNGPPFVVNGGVFVFRNVRIRPLVTVRGVGPNPMIWIVTNSFVVEGRLSVDGQDGESVNTLNSAQFPSKGGVAGPTGGDGGLGSPGTTMRSFIGQQGYGPLQIPAVGGVGGLLSCVFQDIRASGGGGGSFATHGDPYYSVALPQRTGFGGATGLKTPSSPPGLMLFRDNKKDNDFWGIGVNVFTRQIVRGELPIPVGGQGGGGGGDHPPDCSNPNFISDRKGGGGGGGGGVVIVYSLGSVTIAANGQITANGGNGGGGEWAGSNRFGGGGGAGAGGMVVVMAKQTIDIQVHGETYANQNYDFAISADGGIGLQSAFGGPAFLEKYPPKPGVLPPTSGGFGGMGIVQLVTPPGTNSDKTNTILDDNVRLFRGKTQLSGAEKIRYLAWRGFQNQQGVFVDDTGRATNIGANEGDIRPAPILLPLLQ